MTIHDLKYIHTYAWMYKYHVWCIYVHMYEIDPPLLHSVREAYFYVYMIHTDMRWTRGATNKNKEYNGIHCVYSCLVAKPWCQDIKFIPRIDSRDNIWAAPMIGSGKQFLFFSIHWLVFWYQYSSDTTSPHVTGYATGSDLLEVPTIWTICKAHFSGLNFREYSPENMAWQGGTIAPFEDPWIPNVSNLGCRTGLHCKKLTPCSGEPQEIHQWGMCFGHGLKPWSQSTSNAYIESISNFEWFWCDIFTVCFDGHFNLQMEIAMKAMVQVALDWVNYNDLTATLLESWSIGGKSSPFMAWIQLSGMGVYQNLLLSMLVGFSHP